MMTTQNDRSGHFDDGLEAAEKYGSTTPFQRVTDDPTGGCGCACHTGIGRNSTCEHCAVPSADCTRCGEPRADHEYGVFCR